MMSDMRFRPAQRPIAEWTLEEALAGGASGAASAADTGRSMAHVARGHLASANDIALRTGRGCGTALWATAGSALAVATVTVALGLGLGLASVATQPASASTRPADVGGTTAEPQVAVVAVRANARLPLDADVTLPAQRPVRRDSGSLTAAVGGIIGGGFAKPAKIGRLALGRLAEELPAKRSTPLERYAALGKPETSGNRSLSGSRLDRRISTGGATVSCLPSSIRRVLNEVVANFGPIRINSAGRSHARNAAVGGARRSMHLECRAVDFAYSGGRRGALIKFLRNHDSVGGLGNYGHGGHIHIDDGPHRSW